MTKIPNILVSIIMGSETDLPVMKDAELILNSFGISSEIKVVSAHRTTERMLNYAKAAKKKGIKVIIAGAGGSAHLPGMVASITTIPVIGVPIKTASLDGLDSLMSIVQMPPGVPVATVAINGAKNAGLLACSILSISRPYLLKKLNQFKEKMRKEVKLKNTKLDQVGLEKYLK